MSHDREFIGVFSKSNLPGKSRRYEKFIVNLADENQPGTHWLAVRKIDRLALIFDSYGLPPPMEIVRYLKKCSKFYNSIQYQGESCRFHCGHLCVLFLLSKCPTFLFSVIKKAS